MEKNQDSVWHDYWLNLKTGYDLFEQHRIPPNVEVAEGIYVFD